MIPPAALAWTKPIDAYLMLGRLANMAAMTNHPAAGSLERLQGLIAGTLEYDIREKLNGWIHGTVAPYGVKLTPEMECQARLLDPVLDQVCTIRDWLREPDTIES